MNRLQRLGHPIWVAGCLLGCAVNDPASAAAPVPLVAQQDAPLFPAGSADDHDPYDSGGVLIPEQASYDVLFYDLDIEVFPEERAIRGTVGIEASLGGPLTHFVVDLAPELEVEAALWIDEESAAHERPFERRGGRIWIDLGRTFQPEDRLSMRIRYGGKPRVAKNAPWDGGVTWAKTPSGEHWIATTCQGEGADIWWPVKDHVSDEPEAMGIHVTVPEPLVAACNGRLLGVDEADGKRTYHWGVSTPINAYAVALNIAPYEVIEGELESVSGETFPVFFWVLPEHLEKGKVLFEEILDHVRFHEELLGPYPFRIDKYGVAETPHLGMEHQSIIAYGARFDNGAMTGGQDWGFDALHHHELSHEWWGNLVTNAQWSDMWLHEGFGSYMQPLYLESRQSKDRYHAYMKSVRQRMTNRQPLASRETLSSSEIYGGDIYFKGAWVLHTLRYLIGDEAFFESLRRMAYPTEEIAATRDGSACRFARTVDYHNLVEEITGQDLDWFFEVYVRQPDLPELVSERDGDTVRVRWKTPGDLPFPMPVEVKIGGKVQKLGLSTDQPWEVTLPEGTDLELDPTGWILKK